MTAPLTSTSLNQRKIVANTITGLKRWSCHSKHLPPVSHVKAVHVYDFDNTLFMSPLPNQKLWHQSTVARLQEQNPFGSGGGWWHDERILAATGEGIEKELPRAWEGWWNEQIVELVRLSAQQDDALTVLLTGRGEHNFADLIKRMITSKNLEFDMLCLKPEAGPNNQRFGSTMKFKQAILEDLVLTYKDSEAIRVYEDRPKHTKVFREYFEDLNRRIFSATTPVVRKPIMAEVIQVTDQAAKLDPVIEVAEIQRMINSHNSQLTGSARPLEIERTVYYTGYLVSPSDTTKLLSLMKIPPNINENDIKFMGNNVMIVPRPADPTMLAKVGGIGYKQTWQVTGISLYNSNVWAARVAPIPNISVIHTNNNTPLIVLATYKAGKPADANKIQSWQSVGTDKQYIIQTTVGEKVQLRIEAESAETENEVSERRTLKRRHSPTYGPLANQRNGPHNEENRRLNGNNASARGGNPNPRRGGGGGGSGGRNGNQNNNRGGRPGRGGGGGGGGGGGASNRRQGQRGGYKFLDDMGSGNGRYNSQRGEPYYDDYVPGGAGHDAAFPAAFPARGMDNEGGLPYGK